MTIANNSCYNTKLNDLNLKYRIIEQKINVEQKFLTENSQYFIKSLY